MLICVVFNTSHCTVSGLVKVHNHIVYFLHLYFDSVSVPSTNVPVSIVGSFHQINAFIVAFWSCNWIAFALRPFTPLCMGILSLINVNMVHTEGLILNIKGGVSLISVHVYCTICYHTFGIIIPTWNLRPFITAPLPPPLSKKKSWLRTFEEPNLRNSVLQVNWSPACGHLFLQWGV